MAKKGVAKAKQNVTAAKKVAAAPTGPNDFNGAMKKVAAKKGAPTKKAAAVKKAAGKKKS